ncbi:MULTISPECIES: stage II sporulation protein P [unclassified Bacillus (in: firmicutes)]|uniref:stage II sporulation protein P n=1 Tax=unclassified Bacillus (in: firmicutes) TaxID=185979 RepID=UPI001BEB6561|nr:stage II sporulation protein P [Bacillus sp. ISL-78]MBT2627727.1 stage II sporulation protein P [Bacillus sp. ISL-101]
MTIIAWISLFGENQYILKSYHKGIYAISKNNEESITASNKNPSVFIYHTHTTESFTPLLKNKDLDE